MEITKIINDILIRAYEEAKESKHEYITPEHFLLAALEEKEFRDAIINCGGDVDEIRHNLIQYLEDYVAKNDKEDPEESLGVQNLLFIATQQAAFSGRKIVSLEHVMSALYALDNSYAVYYLEEQGITKRDLLFQISHGIQGGDRSLDEDFDDTEFYEDEELEEITSNKKSLIDKYTIDLTKLVTSEESDPLIGRIDIIERTLQILCRRTKNNPIHVGEPGVGKTAITLGLAKLISQGKVPTKLINAKVFSLDLGAILAGTKYRGDFEERIKSLLDEIKKYENPIVYIDEIHTMVGAGALESGALDGAGLIKSYLLEGKIRFIGATTYDEYKKHFEKDKGLTRRFQTIEVKEPTVDEAIKILEGLKVNFERYHKVKYTSKALESAVILSNKYINDKFLPDKAIDIIDEAGSYISMNRKDDKVKRIDDKVIEEIISKICRIPKQTVESTEVSSLKNLESELKENIFGQDKAVDEVVRCIKMSRAGLNDENKPVASMLFVGPTGVGKTEIAKTLSKIMGVDLVRFDMSEYTEKHAAAKLIGSPPGYVGYEEGGLLTDTIRKKPNCVLLLDEVEKAHNDILSVLLQVMDYATLTDNKGRKADFRNCVIIMTSNAGAKNIGKSLVGFGEREIKGEAITEEVKKFFTPEFRNRLDKVIVFNHIDEKMATNIAKKQLSLFKDKLKNKKVQMSFSDECIKYVSNKGVSKEFGAREILRVINSELKPLLVDEILFGKLSSGGKCFIDISGNKFIIKI